MDSNPNKSSDAYEPSPTSAPPEDVDIPVDTFYGDNLPISPPEPKDELKTEAHKSSVSSSKPNTSSSNSDQPTSSPANKSIKIGIIPFLLMIITLGIGIFVLGNKFKVNIKDGKPFLEEYNFRNELPETTENETNDVSNGSSTGEGGTKVPGTQKQKRNLNFLRDLGLYKRENSYTADELASTRLQMAKNTVIWVTNEPNEEKILSLLSAIKNRSPMPIFIITGAETPNNRIQGALNAGFSVSRITSTLEIPYSILLIDDRILMDISREHWIWETTDKEIISQTAQWANELLKNAVLLNNKLQ